MADPVIVVDCDVRWSAVFESLRVKIVAALGLVAAAVEHVGSTAVPGLPAKPVIDIDVLLDSENSLALAIQRLARLGYVHQGNLEIAGREAFLAPPDSPPHHLYVCVPGSEEFGRHIAFRDYLRAHPAAVAEYAELKRELSARFPHDRGAYCNGKSGFVSKILSLMHGSKRDGHCLGKK